MPTPCMPRPALPKMSSSNTNFTTTDNSRRSYLSGDYWNGKALETEPQTLAGIEEAERRKAEREFWEKNEAEAYKIQ